jgi:hypothetical protein
VDLHLPFYVAGALSGANLIYGYFIVPESLPPSAARRFNWPRSIRWAPWPAGAPHRYPRPGGDLHAGHAGRR